METAKSILRTLAAFTILTKKLARGGHGRPYGKCQMKTREVLQGCLGGVVLLTTLAALSMFVFTSREAVPDRAKFVYASELKVVVPYPEIGKPVFYPVPGKFRDIDDSMNSQWDGVVTWGEIKSANDAFRGFSLPKGEGWDGFVLYGKAVPLWQSLFLGSKSRWDEQGYWRY
mgnify:CR=1 FL=1